MKKIILIILTIFGSLQFTSCSDELDQQPNDSFSPDTFYQTVEDFEIATKGIYEAFIADSDISGNNYYGSSFLSRPDIMSDNVIIAQAGRHSNQLFHEWRHTPDNNWDLMLFPYIVTNRANLVIENIDKLDDGDVKNNYLGEARAARAIALFDMLKVYSKIPTQSADAMSSLGMPVITETDPAVQKLRPTVAVSYQFIVDELEAAKNLVNDDNGSGRINKNAVNAMLSRVYLYLGEYDLCVNAANAVATPISSMSNFADIWTDASNDGVILKIEQNQILDNTNIGVEWSQSNGGVLVPEYVMSYELYNLYATDDVRRDAYTFFGTDAQGNNYNAIKKWIGETGQNNGKLDAKVIRAAEVYLNKAEAYYFMGGHESDALNALNQLRSKRYNNYVAGTESGTALLNAIKLERRLELFAEGHRFFDIKRWNESITRSATEGEFFDGTGTPAPSSFQNLPAGDTRYQLPIPQREINIFPEFQQNPGY